MPGLPYVESAWSIKGLDSRAGQSWIDNDEDGLWIYDIMLSAWEIDAGQYLFVLCIMKPRRCLDNGNLKSSPSRRVDAGCRWPGAVHTSGDVAPWPPCFMQSKPFFLFKNLSRGNSGPAKNFFSGDVVAPYPAFSGP